jgi:hypothetical protein
VWRRPGREHRKAIDQVLSGRQAVATFGARAAPPKAAGDTPFAHVLDLLAVTLVL